MPFGNLHESRRRTDPVECSGTGGLAARACIGRGPCSAVHPGTLLADDGFRRCDLVALRDIRARLRGRPDMPLAHLAATRCSRADPGRTLVAWSRAGISCRCTLVRHIGRRGAGAQAIRARVHDPGLDHHDRRHQGCARAGVPACVPAVCHPGWRDPGANAHGLDRGLYRQRIALVGCARVAGGESFLHSLGPLVGGRGLQRNPVHHRVAHGWNDLRGHCLHQHASPRPVRCGFGHRADHRQLAARLPDRDACPSLQQQACGWHRSRDLWLGVLRPGDGVAVLGRFVLATGGGARSSGE